MHWNSSIKGTKTCTGQFLGLLPITGDAPSPTAQNRMTEDSSIIDSRAAGSRLVDAHASEDPFAAAFKATRMPMIITDPRQPDNPIIFCNKAFNDLTGFDNDELIGRNCRILQGPQTSSETIGRIRDAAMAG